MQNNGDFRRIYENGLHDRFEHIESLPVSDSDRDLIVFEKLVGMTLLRPENAKILKENTEKLCNYCGEEFETRQTKVSHVIEKHPKSCPYCTGTFVHLGNHIGVNHKSLQTEFRNAKENHESALRSTYPFSCDICQKKFRLFSLVKRHQVCHNTENLVSCKVCGKTFKRHWQLLRHTKDIHDSTKYACKICKYETPRLYRLRMHEQKEHSGIIRSKVDRIWNTVTKCDEKT